MAQGLPGRLRPRIFSTFGTTRVVRCQPNAPAAFIPEEILGTHFQRLSRPQGTWFCRKEPRKKSSVTPPGIDPGTVRQVAQRLNHYATPGPLAVLYGFHFPKYLCFLITYVYWEMFKHIFSILSTKSGVVVVARLGAGLAGVRLPAWTTDFALLQNVHTGRRAHPFSFPEGKSAGSWGRSLALV